MYFKDFPTMTDDEKYIRAEVFIKEQKFKDEFDEFDSRGTHIVMYDDGGAPAGCCRITVKDGGKIYLGRMAVLKKYRGQSLGTALVTHALELLKAQGTGTVYVAAQTRARGFYEALGFTAFGEEYLEEYCPHIEMKKDI